MHESESAGPSTVTRISMLLGILFLSAYSLAQLSASPELAVSVPVANMYSRASDDSDVVSQAIYGSDVKVLEEASGWAKVRTPDDYTGWMRLDVTLRGVNGAPYATSARTVQVNSLLANLYRETDVSAHRPLLSVPFETRLEVEKEGAGDDAGWLEVRLVDGQKAWVQDGDVNANTLPLTIEESIGLGKRFLGVTDLWGGRSSLGYDCSRIHPDAGAQPGHQYAPRRRLAGRMEWCNCGGSQASAGGRSPLLWQRARPHHAHRHVHWSWRVHP